MERRIVVALLTLTLLTAPQLSTAYEDDVHFGLTKWLALQAGFTEPQAGALAASTVWVDHSVFRATFLVPWYACVRRDAFGSREIQKIHFPGDGKVPGKAALRAVTPRDTEALRLFNDELRAPAKDPDVRIGNLGRSFHPLQDSWSHQGVPGLPMPWVCHEEYSWGHPKARGDWNSHDADLTHKYRDDALQMARATFEHLCQYATTVMKRSCTKKFDSDLLVDVRAFNNAGTKAEKRAWFEARGFKETGFIDSTSLSRGRHYERRAVDAMVTLSNPEALGRSEEVRFMLDFFTRWFASGGPSVQDLIDAEQFQYRLERSAVSPPVDPRLAGLLLELWRVREHGDVAAVLHNTKELSESAVVDALNSTKDVNYSYKSVAQALMPLDKAGAPMVLKTYEGPEGKELVAFVRLRHAPYEYVVVTARYKDGKYRVVRIDSVVDR